jgi:hypothetical protein
MAQSMTSRVAAPFGNVANERWHHLALWGRLRFLASALPGATHVITRTSEKAAGRCFPPTIAHTPLNGNALRNRASMVT